MAPRDAIICFMCGGKYFSASLPHHQKVCARKHGIVLQACEYCGLMVPKPETQIHVKLRCPNAPTVKQENNESSQFLTEQIKSDMDGRVPCVACGKKFAKARITKHEAICLAVNQKVPRVKFDSACQRNVDNPSIFLDKRQDNTKQLLAKDKGSMLQSPKINTVILSKKNNTDNTASQIKPCRKTPTSRCPKSLKSVQCRQSVKVVDEGGTRIGSKTVPTSCLRRNGVGQRISAQNYMETIPKSHGIQANQRQKILQSNMTSPDNPFFGNNEMDG